MKNLIILPVLLLTLLVGNPAFSADFEKGLDAAQKGDIATALKEWKPLAEDGKRVSENPETEVSTSIVDIPEQVLKMTDMLVELLSDDVAVEFKDYRTYHDVTGSIIPYTRSYVVLFSIEGYNKGSNYDLFMALFSDAMPEDDGTTLDFPPTNAGEDKPSGEGYFLWDHIRVGGKGLREVSNKNLTVENGQFILETLEYVPEDPLCCPSKEGKLVIRLKYGRLDIVP